MAVYREARNDKSTFGRPLTVSDIGLDVIARADVWRNAQGQDERLGNHLLAVRCEARATVLEQLAHDIRNLQEVNQEKARTL